MERDQYPSGANAPPPKRPTLDELDDFLSGQADDETRERIGNQLLDPASPLRQFVEAVRDRSEELTGWDKTNDASECG